MIQFTDSEAALIIYCIEQMSSSFDDIEEQEFISVQEKLSSPGMIAAKSASPPCDYSEVQKYYSGAPQ